MALIISQPFENLVVVLIPHLENLVPLVSVVEPLGIVVQPLVQYLATNACRNRVDVLPVTFTGPVGVVNVNGYLEVPGEIIQTSGLVHGGNGP